MDNLSLVRALTNAQDLIEGAYLNACLDNGFAHSHFFLWNTDAPNLGGLKDFIASERTPARQRAVARFAKCVVSADLRASGHLQGYIAGTYHDVHSGLARLKELLPENAEEERGLQCGFWRQSSSGGQLTLRRIVVPAWSEIEANYPVATRAPLAALNRVREAGDDGRLMLWHGPPGTGKSFALRALSWEWRTWADFSYILDAGKFSSDVGYMFKVLLDSDPDKWTIFVVEDAGGQLASNAEGGDALSALLNVSDGAAGQGIKAMFLFTTNLALNRIHPAITRAGRCSSVIKFDSFPQAEARQWLSERGSTAAVNWPVALSDLYGILKGRPLPAPTRKGMYL